MTVALSIETSRRFRYLWLKSVVGFDARVHCARCLKGGYHPGLSADGMRNGDTAWLEVDLDAAPVHYLCGVTSKWENNLHLPFAKDPGAPPISIERYGAIVAFPEGGVRLLEIMPPIQGIDPAFGTCRNWLFGKGYFEQPAMSAERYAATASAPRL
jgi:hypothetical protein